MAEEIIIGKLIIDNSDLDRALLASKQSIIEMEAEQRKLKKETDNLSTANETQLQTFIANETALKRARSEYAANQKSVLELQRAQTGLDDALKANIKTQADAAANTAQLVAARRQIDTSTVEGAKAISEINKKIDSNNKLIKESSSALEQQKIGIGAYPGLMGAVSSSFGSATQSVIGFAQQGKDILGEFTNTIGQVREAQEQSAQATKAFEQAQIIAVQATEASNTAKEKATAIGFRYAAGEATQTEVEAANTAVTVANTTATEAQAVATNASTVATNASTVATKLLGTAMLGIPIFALLALLAPLITFLTSTQEGMDAITSVTRPVVAIFKSLIGVFQTVGKNLFEAFSNPKKVLNDLYEFVKTNLINRFKAFGEILDGILSLDFGKVADGVLQATTGVEGLTGKIAGAAKATGDFLSEAAKKGQEIDRLQKSIEKSQLVFNRNQIEYNDAIDEQLKISKDTSLSFKEREKAALEIIRVNQRMGDEEAAIIEKKIAKLKIEQSLNDTNREGKQEMIDLEVALDAAMDRGLEAQLEQTRVIAGARKEAAAKAKEAADKALQEEIKQRRNIIDIIKLEAEASNLTTEQRLANAQKVFNLENELAKKSFNGLEQRKALLQNQQNLSNEILAITEEQINKELEAQKKAFEEKSKITKAEKDAAILSAEDLANAQILLLNKTLLTEKDYAEQVAEINKGKNESIAIANKSFEEGEAERKKIQLDNEKALDEVAFQIRLQNIEDRKTEEDELQNEMLKAQYDREQELLQQSLDNKEISQELFNQKKLLSDQKYANDVKKIDKALIAQRRNTNVQMVNDSIDALTNLFGESKSLAIASALINTYQGIASALTAPSLAQKIIGVAYATATGFAAVRNIMATNRNSTAAGSTPGASTPVTTSGSGNFVNSAQTTTIATVSDRPVEQNTVVSPPVLVLETLQEVQGQQLIKINSD